MKKTLRWLETFKKADGYTLVFLLLVMLVAFASKDIQESEGSLAAILFVIKLIWIFVLAIYFRLVRLKGD